MKTILSKYPKNKIGELPKVSFPGQIHVVISEREADAAIEYLLKQEIVGIDTETKPCFKRGQHHNVALLQVASHDTCFLFRLNRIGITPSIIKLLEDKSTSKIGLSVGDDIRQLTRKHTFSPQNFVELQKEVKSLGIDDMSLQKLYANIFGERITKAQQLSNWEADSLSEAQKLYAATDAWTCIKLYEEICRLRYSKDFILIKVEEETNNQPVSE